MDLDQFFLEYIWGIRKEEMRREAAFKETYKLYPEENQKVDKTDSCQC
ncbi:hypothetical protein [Bacillus sp. REN3]|nr:hypothetical protein [Bacillus sp. REN3]